MTVVGLAVPVPIMPLGDSITGSPGRRRSIPWNRLPNTGYTNIDFVGTLGPQGCTQAYDGDNEAHGGLPGDQRGQPEPWPYRTWSDLHRPLTGAAGNPG